MGQQDLLELILIDQCATSDILLLLAGFRDGLAVTYEHTGFLSLADARNLALKYTTGEYILFGDDDCWYPSGTFAGLKRWIEEHAFPAILCGSTSDPHSGKGYGAWRAEMPDGIEIKPSRFMLAVSITLAVRRDACYFFDRRLGLGARYHSGEEIDLMLEILKEHRMFGSRAFMAYHPYKSYKPKEAYRGAVGTGFVLAKAIKVRLQFGVLGGLAQFVFRSAGGIPVHLLLGNGSRSLACVTRLLGLIHGAAAGMTCSHPQPVPLACPAKVRPMPCRKE